MTSEWIRLAKTKFPTENVVSVPLDQEMNATWQLWTCSGRQGSSHAVHNQSGHALCSVFTVTVLGSLESLTLYRNNAKWQILEQIASIDSQF